MQTTLHHVAEQAALAIDLNSKLSFRPFIEFLKKRKAYKNEVKNGYISYVIEQFEQTPRLLDNVEVTDIKDYAPQLQLIYNTLCPIVEDEETHLWALGLPLRPVLFYSTNALTYMMGNMSTFAKRNSALSKTAEEEKNEQLKFAYRIILEKCYNIPSFFKSEIIRFFLDENTGQTRFYRLHLDTRFIDIINTKELPDISIDALKSRVGYDHEDMLPLLQRILPLDLFRFEGFSIMNAKDITASYAIENIKNTLLNFHSSNEETCFVTIENSLKALVNDPDIEFGLLPVLLINNKLIFDKTIFAHSMLMNLSGSKGLAEETYLSLAKKYVDEPRPVIYKTISKNDEAKQDYLRLLKKEKVAGYALLPIYSNNLLIGVLEVYSKVEKRIDEIVLSKLDPAMPLLAQLLAQGIHEFEEEIEQVIKEKFTALQPSVQWKFNEAAWHFVRDKHAAKKNRDIEDIEFKEVYPLYGTIDIRDSTINRNASLRKDLLVQFSTLIGVLKELKERSGFGLADEKIFSSKQWLQEINNETGFNKQIELDQFLENNIIPFLLDFKKGNKEYADIVDKYFTAIDVNAGIASIHRRELEESMTTIISAVNFYLEQMKDEIQNAYPCYFEKFRTDGLEYDIYIGQAIAPDKPFSEIYLKNLRLMQLTSMAAIAKYTNSLMAGMTIPIETTQLIFVHSNQITIKFRKDEKRFDVEGAYNIRYHIVKKRIDKAFIKGTPERLTQPRKIAIVYFTQQEANEYLGYINYLQEKKLLNEEIEDLELEEMQGVNGLRALRVSVNI